jgi:hypothetical protein
MDMSKAYGAPFLDQIYKTHKLDPTPSLSEVNYPSWEEYYGKPAIWNFLKGFAPLPPIYFSTNFEALIGQNIPHGLPLNVPLIYG